MDLQALKESLSYNQETGEFKRLFRVRGNQKDLDQPTGTIQGGDRILISLFNVMYRAEDLAWFYIHGKWPINGITHINGIRKDNRLSNLKLKPEQASPHKNRNKNTFDYWNYKN